LFSVDLTGTDKGELGEAAPIWDCDFLSRSFRREYGQVFAPLAFESLISQLYYVRVPKGMRGDGTYLEHQLQQNMDNVMRELVEYPRAQAHEIRAKICDFVREHGVRVSVPELVQDFAMAKLGRQ
jgi:hypothetical protein